MAMARARRRRTLAKLFSFNNVSESWGDDVQIVHI